MKINCVVFGLTGLDTASIVRAMKTRDEFTDVVWFGVFPECDYKLPELYQFQSDYDYSIS